MVLQPYHVNDKTPSFVTYLLMSHPETLDFFENIRDDKLPETLIIRDENGWENDEIFETRQYLQHVVAPLLEKAEIIKVNKLRKCGYEALYSEIKIDPIKFGPERFATMVSRRSNLMQKNVAVSSYKNLMAGLLVGSKDIEFTENMFQQFRNLVFQYRDRLEPDTSEEKARFTITILGVKERC